MKVRLTLLGLVVASLAVSAQQGQEEMPRFRAGANLVRVDAYFTKAGAAVSDLKQDELEILEDDKPQKIEGMELIRPRPSGPPSALPAEPRTVGEMQDQMSVTARLFTLFLDSNFVSIDGSYHANKPMVDMLDRVIGPDDMFGVMTPDMSPGNVTYGRRTSSIERYVRETWNWGERFRITHKDPHEEEIESCYPEVRNTEAAGIAQQMINRRREQITLDALDALVNHLDGLRPERKFVVVMTEGWPLYQRNDALARPLDNQVPGRTPVGVDPRTGKLSTRPEPQDNRSASYDSCERERVMLAYIDHTIQFRELLQRANRANVSFYPVDARGLVVFDQPIGPAPPPPPTVDQAILRNRHDNLRIMAENTDGVAVVDNSRFPEIMKRMFDDTGSYYLLRYYSTNPKLDGRFRRITVKVKRPDVDVRARAGYLAPTEAEARAAGATLPRGTTRAGNVISGTPATSSAPAAAPPSVVRALDAIAPARGNLPVRIQATGARGIVRAVVELDAATVKQQEWMSGGDLRLVIEPERGSGQAYTVVASLAPGQRSFTATTSSENAIPPGRYSARAELRAKSARQPIQVTTFVTVPAATAEVGTNALALRRGPSTGLAYVATADPRFRRTERIRIEVPLMGEGFAAKGRMLTREGQPMPLVVNYSTRVDEEQKLTLGMAEVVLAPLAEGEYVLELTLDKAGKSDVVSYGFRIIP